MGEPLIITRHKVGDQKYELRLPDGEVVAIAVKTGTHLDDYPWDVYHVDGWTHAGRWLPSAQESLRVCVDIIRHDSKRIEGN